MNLEKSVPTIFKQQLDEAISIAIEKYKREYGEARENNFSRKRILPNETMIKLLLSFGGGSLNTELHEAEINVTASAFLQQRDKLSSWLFEEVFVQTLLEINDKELIVDTERMPINKYVGNNEIYRCYNTKLL